MKRLIRLLRPALIYFCTATTIAQVMIVAVVWWKGGLTADKRARMLEVIYDVDRAALRQQRQSAQLQRAGRQAVAARAVECPDLRIRDGSFRQSLGELLALENAVKQEQQRSELRKMDFDGMLAKLEKEALDASLLEVRRTLEVMQSRQAKAQLLRMLQDNALDDVVAMVKTMPLAKRKRIFSEFKTPEEAQRLREILRQLRQVADRPAAGASQQTL